MTLLQPRALFGSFAPWGQVVPNLFDQFKKRLTAFDLIGQTRRRFLERVKVVPDFWGSCMASYLGAATCMLPTLFGVAWHLPLPLWRNGLPGRTKLDSSLIPSGHFGVNAELCTISNGVEKRAPTEADAPMHDAKYGSLHLFL